MRVAVKVAYDGTRFSGSQIQPGVRTVHAEVASALGNLGHASPRLAWAGRTDAGVSAAANVVVFETDMALDVLAPALTHAMTDAWAWAVAVVDDAFEPRYARLRRYRYFLQTGLDAALVHDTLQAFVGEHDFTSFGRIEGGVSPRRTVTRASATRVAGFVQIDVEGPNFVWNQVRRMVEAARRVAKGEIARDEVVAALDAGRHADFGCAPPEPLILLDVDYGDRVMFQLPSPDASRRIRERLARRIDQTRFELARLDGIHDAMGGAP